MATLSIFNLPIWVTILDLFNYLSNFMGSYTYFLVVFTVCIMFLYFVQFIFRRLRLK